jgi:tyrosine-protein phosphatase SIW14
MASSDASRRTSRTSSCEDMHSAMVGVQIEQANQTKNPYEMSAMPRSNDLDSAREKAMMESLMMAERNHSTASSTTGSSGSSSTHGPDLGCMANFGEVIPGVYRSSYPLSEHFDFCQTLGLRTVVTLVNKDDERSVNLGAFVQRNGIRHVVFNMQGTKKEEIPHHTMQAILGVVLDRSCYPLLIHCNHGKHRTGCVVAATRKIAGWPVDTVVEEYRTFAEPKVRDCDVAYITALEVASFRGITTQAVSAISTTTYRSMRQRTFVRLLAFTFTAMLIFMCSSWQWDLA